MTDSGREAVRYAIERDYAAKLVRKDCESVSLTSVGVQALCARSHHGLQAVRIEQFSCTTAFIAACGVSRSQKHKNSVADFASALLCKDKISIVS
jgi:hypothetical protein